jgi:RNA polymerase sigma-70 factor (ECF subfamily)
VDVLAAEQDSRTADPVSRPSTATPTVDPVAHLTAVFRDYPGLRALIMRSARDPELAADILQDAAVTTLEKLKSGEIERPEGIGGYLYRVALNHLRNHRRKDRGPVSSADDLETLVGGTDEPERDVEREQWAETARRMLESLPASRDREMLVRLYIEDEDKASICAALNLSDEHFNRVIFRARNRFQALLEGRGFSRSDLPTVLATTVAALLAGVMLATQPNVPAATCPGAGPLIRAAS